MTSSSESENNEYVVEEIASKRVYKGATEYLVKWKDYPESQNTWEPKRSLSSCLDLIKNYERRLRETGDASSVPDKPGKPARPGGAEQQLETRHAARAEGIGAGAGKKMVLGEEGAMETGMQQDDEMEAGRADNIYRFNRIVGVRQSSTGIEYAVECSNLQSNETSVISISSHRMKQILPELLVDFFEQDVRYNPESKEFGAPSIEAVPFPPRFSELGSEKLIVDPVDHCADLALSILRSTAFEQMPLKLLPRAVKRCKCAAGSSGCPVQDSAAVGSQVMVSDSAPPQVQEQEQVEGGIAEDMEVQRDEAKDEAKDEERMEAVQPAERDEAPKDEPEAACESMQDPAQSISINNQLSWE